VLRSDGQVGDGLLAVGCVGVVDGDPAQRRHAGVRDGEVVVDGLAGQHAGLISGDGDRHRRGPRRHPEVDHRQRSHRACDVAPVGGAVEAQLPFPTPSPALEGGVVEQGAGVGPDVVGAAGGCGRGGAAGTQVDGRDGGHLAWRVAEELGGVEAELSRAARSPALEGGVVQHGARVLVGRGDGRSGAAGAQVDGGQRGHLAWDVTEIGGGV